MKSKQLLNKNKDLYIHVPFFPEIKKDRLLPQQTLTRKIYTIFNEKTNLNYASVRP